MKAATAGATRLRPTTLSSSLLFNDCQSYQDRFFTIRTGVLAHRSSTGQCFDFAGVFAFQRKVGMLGGIQNVNGIPQGQCVRTKVMDDD